MSSASWWSIRTGPLHRELNAPVPLWGGLDSCTDPSGSYCLLPFMVCLLQGPATAPPPTAPSPSSPRASPTGPFIPVTSHKNGHQLRTRWWSPDPSIKAERGDWWTTRLCLCFLLTWEENSEKIKKQQMIDFLCLAKMCSLAYCGFRRKSKLGSKDVIPPWLLERQLVKNVKGSQAVIYL